MRSGSGRALPQRHVCPLCCDPPLPLLLRCSSRGAPLAPTPSLPQPQPRGTLPDSPSGDHSLSPTPQPCWGPAFPPPADTTAFAFLHPHGGTHGPEPLGCSWDGAGPGNVARAPLVFPGHHQRSRNPQNFPPSGLPLPSRSLNQGVLQPRAVTRLCNKAPSALTPRLWLCSATARPSARPSICPSICPSACPPAAAGRLGWPRGLDSWLASSCLSNRRHKHSSWLRLPLCLQPNTRVPGNVPWEPAALGAWAGAQGWALPPTAPVAAGSRLPQPPGTCLGCVCGALGPRSLLGSLPAPSFCIPFSCFSKRRGRGRLAGCCWAPLGIAARLCDELGCLFLL